MNWGRRGCAVGAMLACVWMPSCHPAREASPATASPWARWFGDPEDYAQYRRARLTPGFEQRLQHAWRYLRGYPKGAWRAEVLAWFGAAEERYRRQAWHDRARLSNYLKVLPDGPHAAHVQRRLFDLEGQAHSRAAEDASLLRRERERGQAFDRAAHGRRVFQLVLSGWVRGLVGPRDAGAALVGEPATGAQGGPAPLVAEAAARWASELRAALAAEPAAHCEEHRCQKVIAVDFELPTQAGLEPRSVAFTIDVTFEAAGSPSRLALSGHRLLDRIAESVTLREVGRDDLQGRAEAIGLGVQFASAALDGSVPEAECPGEAISPVVLQRSCGGRTVRVVIGEVWGEDDRLVVTFEPSLAPASPVSP